MKRCAKCILPENYPGIILDEGGICDRCVAYKERKYLGGEALKEKIESFLRTKKDINDNYDCVLAFSGGRDSTYLLYYLAKVLNLRVLAYTIDNGFIPKETTFNIKNTVDILAVKLVIEKNERLEKCIRHHILSFVHRPSGPTIELLCTGCRVGLMTMVTAFARKNRIPVIISGGNPLECGGHKQRIMLLNPNSRNISLISLILGYLFQVIRNPRWILNYDCVVAQIQEYPRLFYPKVFLRNSRTRDPIKIAPFYSYIRWDEKVLVSTIKDKLNWRETPDAKSTWRGDCGIALLKLYLWKTIFGFSDRDVGLSHLIRDGQISREEALERIEKEGNVSEEVVKAILDKLGLEFSALKVVLETSGFSDSQKIE